jgi:hypothetical protein
MMCSVYDAYASVGRTALGTGGLVPAVYYHRRGNGKGVLNTGHGLSRLRRAEISISVPPLPSTATRMFPTGTH